MNNFNKYENNCKNQSSLFPQRHFETKKDHLYAPNKVNPYSPKDPQPIFRTGGNKENYNYKYNNSTYTKQASFREKKPITSSNINHFNCGNSNRLNSENYKIPQPLPINPGNKYNLKSNIIPSNNNEYLKYSTSEQHNILPSKPNSFITNSTFRGNNFLRNTNNYTNSLHNVQQPKQMKSTFNRSSSQIPKTFNNTPLNYNYTYNTNKQYKPQLNKPVSLTDIYTSKYGLINTTNTCYMNTCIQILTHCPSFVKRLFQNEFSSNTTTIPPQIAINREQLITSLLKDIMLRLTKDSFQPKVFIETFLKKHSTEYMQNIQQDTVEFCRTLLEDINKETNEVKNVSAYQELNTKNKTKRELNKEYDLLFKRRENSLIIDTFYIQLATSFKCDNCKFNSYSFQKILDLPLLIPPNDFSNIDIKATITPYAINNNFNIRNVSLMDLCKYYFKDEQNEWSEPCEQCKLKTKHTKSMRIASLPNVLIISIQRYLFSSPYKDNTNISFQEIIDLNDFVDTELIEHGNTKYYLFGLMNHRGLMDFGHYYAHVKIEGMWYEFNDYSVKLVGSSISDKNVYCLFYSKERV